MHPDEKKQLALLPDPFPEHLHNFRFAAQRAEPGDDYSAEGILTIRGITYRECLVIGRILSECWHHDPNTLFGIFTGLKPSTMEAYWRLSARGTAPPRPPAKARRDRHHTAPRPSQYATTP